MKTGLGRVFVLGLDGATFEIIDPLIAEGRLPTLGKLIEKGCARELLSTILPFKRWLLLILK